MKQMPKAAEQLAKRIISFGDSDEVMTDEAIKRNVHKSMIEFAKLHVTAALKAASEIADQWENSGELSPEIINCYPLIDII